MTKPTTPERHQKPQRDPGRYILCIGKWAAMEMLSIQYGFPLKEPEEATQKQSKKRGTPTNG